MPTLPEKEEPVTSAEATAQRIRWAAHTAEKAVVGPEIKDFRFVALLLVAVIAASRAGGVVGALGAAAVVLLGVDIARSRK